MALPDSNTLPLLEQTVAAAGKIRTALADGRLTTGIARLYSQHTRLREGRTGLPTWQDSEADAHLLDALRLVDAALLERSADIPEWHHSMRRAAELMEWLSQTITGFGEDMPLRLMAAAAYQIAGYPARSSSLVAGSLSLQKDESAILRAFLKADFPNLLEQLADYWADVFQSASYGKETAESLVVTETTRALGILCSAMRWGYEPRLERALTKLGSVAQFMLHSTDEFSWMLARLCAIVGEGYVETSLRTRISALNDQLTRDGRIALERYLRHSYSFRKALAWPSQEKGIKRLQTGENFTLCTPTGSGKTTIAELAIIRALFRSELVQADKAPLALYLVPSRALAAEVEARFSNVLRGIGQGLNITVTGLYGGTDWGPTDAWLTSDDPTVLICTFEKAEALVRFLGPLFVRRVTLVVLDEAHMVNFSGDSASLSDIGNRTLRLESLGMRLFAALDPDRCQTIALSAVAQNVEAPLAQWISGTEGKEPIKTEYRSTRQLVGRLECSGSRFRIEYDLLDGSSLGVASGGGKEPLYIPDPFPPCPAAKGFDSPEKLIRPYVFWSAMHLAAPDSDGNQRAVLISVAERPEGYAQDLLNLLDKIWTKAAIPRFFSVPEKGAKLSLWERCLASCEDYFGIDSREYRLLSRGVVVHHGKMPGIMARLLVQVIDQGIVHLVIATSTLTEGVNLPFDTILVPTLRRYNGDITPQEFTNLVGRAGRPMRTVEGRTLVVLHANQNDWASVQARRRYTELIQKMTQVSQSGAVSPRSAVAELMEHLEDVWRQVRRGGTPEDFQKWLEVTVPMDHEENMQVDDARQLNALDALDGILLPALVEIESLRGNTVSSTDLEEGLIKIWRRSYAMYASAEQERLSTLFITRGSALARIYSDVSARRRIYCTSLPPREAQTLLAIYPEIKASLEAGTDYAVWDVDQRFDFIRRLIETISSVRPFALQKLGRIGTNDPWDLLRWWLIGQKASVCPSPTQVSAWHSYVAKNFTYRFAWGLGGILATAAYETHRGTLQETTLDSWTAIGLPWIALWLKELVTWGTLEPVAAYLLAKGYEVTRPSAEASAREYYGFQGPQVATNILLDPRRIQAWAEANYEKLNEETYTRNIAFKAVLSRDFTNQQQKEWRVVPGASKKTIHWFDPAGHLLATSSDVNTEGWQSAFNMSHDFLLDPVRKIVNGKPYLRI